MGTNTTIYSTHRVMKIHTTSQPCFQLHIASIVMLFPSVNFGDCLFCQQFVKGGCHKKNVNRLGATTILQFAHLIIIS